MNWLFSLILLSSIVSSCNHSNTYLKNSCKPKDCRIVNYKFQSPDSISFIYSNNCTVSTNHLLVYKNAFDSLSKLHINIISHFKTDTCNYYFTSVDSLFYNKNDILKYFQNLKGFKGIRYQDDDSPEITITFLVNSKGEILHKLGYLKQPSPLNQAQFDQILCHLNIKLKPLIIESKPNNYFFTYFINRNELN